MKYEAERQYTELRDKLGGEWVLDRTAPKPFGPERRPVYSVRQKKGDALVEVAKATAGWDDKRERTEIQRRKEEAADYRYFPDPDLVPVTVEPAQLERIRADMGELPAAQRVRLQSQYGLSAYDAEVVSRQGRAKAARLSRLDRRSPMSATDRGFDPLRQARSGARDPFRPSGSGRAAGRRRDRRPDRSARAAAPSQSS